jgi:hypothetical protein
VQEEEDHHQGHPERKVLFLLKRREEDLGILEMRKTSFWR